MDELAQREYERFVLVKKYIAQILRDNYAELEQMIQSEIGMTEELAEELRTRYGWHIEAQDMERERLGHLLAEEVLSDSVFKQGMEEIGG